jgi:acetylornithine/N-succinyldiaminopimelate aminotransferase
MSIWQDKERKYYMQVVRRQPIVIVRGQGTNVWDENGKEYLDFTAGWAVNTLGHCHPIISQAISDQASTLMHTSNQFYTVPQLKIAELLVENSSMDRVFFCNSGAEANEGAVKLARKYGRLHRNGAYEVITALNSFHGRTIGMIAATGQPHYQENWKPLAPGFVNVEYNNIEAIKQATTDETCAVLLEPIQGEGGVNVPSPGFLKEVRTWCDQQGLLMILDEIQTGVGRLGSLFGYQIFGVEPDVLTLAKGLGGGVPIGAFLSKESAAAMEPGDHGSTFGGNALTCAAAHALLNYVIENKVWENAAQVGEHLKNRLEALKERIPSITQVRGMGLLLAVEFDDNISAQVVTSCNEMGILTNAVRPNAIRLMPPLNLTLGEVDEGVKRLEAGMEKATRARAL